MVKRLLFYVVLSACLISADAQNLRSVKDGDVFAVSSLPLNVSAGNVTETPSKAASLTGTTPWGYYLGGIDGLGGLGVSQAATYWVGYYVAGDGLLSGSSINGINLPLYSTTNMSDLSIWISKDLTTNIVSQDVRVSDLAGMAYNAIALDEPFAIPEGGVYVGVSFKINKATSEGDKYPVLVYGGGSANENSLIMKTSVAGTTSWGDYSGAYGSFGMQLFLSNLDVPDVTAYISEALGSASLPDSEVTVPAVLFSNGSEGVKSIDYTVDVNGQKTSKHLDLATPIAGGFNKTGAVSFTFTALSECVEYDATISIEKINGKDNPESGKSFTVRNKVVSKIATRKTVVEEFTGTGCPWCTRGWVGMEAMKREKENFIGIAFHKYNSSDPMYVANYYPTYSLGIDGAPGCSIDRKALGIDPCYGTGMSIFEDFDYYNAMLPDVCVNVSASYNADSTKVDAKADIEYLLLGDGYSIAYVLTADGLSGTTTVWRQANNYASYLSSQLGYIPEEMSDLAEFCRGGKYGSSYVYLTFNDVMIGSSYSTAGVNQAPKLTGNVVAGGSDNSAYTVSMPTSAALKAAINKDEVYIVALIIAKDGTIANAARAKVGGYIDLAGVDSVTADDGNVVETARYTADGVLLNAPQKGINIVRMSNGETRKVVVK